MTLWFVSPVGQTIYRASIELVIDRIIDLVCDPRFSNTMKQMQAARWLTVVAVSLGTAFVMGMAHAQTAPHQSGTVKAATADSLTLTNAAGQDYTIALPGTAKILVVAPGGTAASATPGTPADVTVGDKAIVIGTAGDAGTSLTAAKMYLMKSAAIAQSHAAADAAWAQGTGGIVKSVDVAAGKVVISSGMKTISISTTPSTIFRHYASGSVSFADAKVCGIGDIKVGDQLRVRGTKSMDGLTLAADEVVAGTFHNYSGLLTAVDATAGTVTLKDLATKKVVTVDVSAGSDVRRMPPMMAQMMAARMKGGASGAAGPGGAAGGGRPAGASRGGTDLSSMLTRMPTEKIAGLKTGDAVMIVASSSATDAAKSTAVTLLVGVEPILTAAPEGDTTLSPWSLGGAPGGEAGGGGPGGGGGR